MKCRASANHGEIIEQEQAEATTDFATASIYAADEKVDPDAVSHGLTRGEAEAWLKERGLSEKQRAVVLARHFEGKAMQPIASEVGMSKSWVAATFKGSPVRECLRHLQRGMPLPVLSAATVPSNAARTAAADAGNRWTLPEAMGFARREIDNYLTHNVNHLAALGLGKLLGSENRRLSEEQMEQIKNMSPLDILTLSLPPGKNVADAIVAYIRLNPRALLSPNTSNLLVVHWLTCWKQPILANLSTAFRVCYQRTITSWLSRGPGKLLMRLSAATKEIRAIPDACVGSCGPYHATRS